VQVRFEFPEPSELPSSSLLQLIDADFKYPGRDDFGLAGLNIGIDMGSRVAIVGPNGAGKTTLMNLLAGKFPKCNLPTMSMKMGRQWWNAFRTTSFSCNTQQHIGPHCHGSELHSAWMGRQWRDAFSHDIAMLSSALVLAVMGLSCTAPESGAASRSLLIGGPPFWEVSLGSTRA